MLGSNVFFQLLLWLFLACSCAVLKGDSSKKYTRSTPPGCIQIGDNLYYDRTEVPNSSWLFYINWTARIFGKSSERYQAALPDTTVWLQHDSCVHQQKTYYFRHPSYQAYPIVGITRQQAIQYTQWRTDRVFEIYLFGRKVIRRNEYPQTPDDYFTVGRYFAGQFKGMVPDTNIRYYIKYTLPTIEQRQLALAHNDSINTVAKQRRVSKYDRFYMEEYPDLRVVEAQVCDTVFTYNGMPIELTWRGAWRRNEIYHLEGNVSEWLSQPNVSAGGSWYHTRAQLRANDTFSDSLPNAWTGFRNVARWVPLPK